MKLNKKLLFRIGALASVLTLNVSLFTYLNQKASEVSAYDTSDLPTNINLNDCSESDIRSYYSSLNSMDASERQGTNLLKNLKTILSNGQKYYNYDSGDNVWKMYEITDRDWVKSPATAIGSGNGTYNPTTNEITNYRYGSGGDNPYIHALYVNRDHTNHNTHAWGDHSQTNYGINREHIWAKSHGFQAGGAAGARGDPMHLWAANGFANNKHSNYFFAFVDKNRSYEDCGSSYSYLKGNYKGNSKNLGGNQAVYEPQDCDKGDIARAVFYMVARYNNYAGATDGFGTNNPNLVLANSLSENSRTGTSTATDPYAMGVLSDLLAWNKLDPVDDYELHRNNLLYRNFTNNRNPFIDFPSWADAIWGTANLDGTGYNSTPTTYAKPATDSIYSGSSVATFGISTNSVSLTVGDTAEVYGMNAEGNITWTVDDNAVVSLNKNSTTNNEKVTITALKNGTAVVTASNGGNSESCTVTVSDNVINYGSLEHPLTITQAKKIIDDNGGELTPEKMYVEGIVTSNTALNTDYNNFDIWLHSENAQPTQEFELYHAYFTDQSNHETYKDADSMVNCKIVAYGYGKKHYSTYELSPSSGSANKPEVLSITPTGPVEKTPQEIIEEMDTSTSLSYRYTKETTEGGATDVFNHSSVGVSGNNYVDWSNKTFTSGVVYTGQTAGGDNSSGDAVQLRSKNSNSGIVVSGNTTGHNVSVISVTWNSATAGGRTLDIYGKSTAYTSPTELYENSTQGTKLGSIVKGTSVSLTITGSYQFIGIRSNNSAIYLDELRIEWGGASATTYDYSSVSIRFGGSLTQELWNELDTDNHVIDGFGVMITTYEVLEGEDIKDFYESAAPDEDDPDIGEEIVDYYIQVSQMDEIIGVGDNTYFWNLKYNIIDFNQVYVAAAYIKTETEYVFFKQATCSVKSLADDYVKNRGYDASVAGGSLANLAK